MQSYEKSSEKPNLSHKCVDSTHKTFNIMTNSTLYTVEPPRVVAETVSMVETKSFTP